MMMMMMKRSVGRVSVQEGLWGAGRVTLDSSMFHDDMLCPYVLKHVVMYVHMKLSLTGFASGNVLEDSPLKCRPRHLLTELRPFTAS